MSLARFQLLLQRQPQYGLLLICLVFVGLTSLYRLATPPFEGPDEGQHFAYIEWLARGKGLPPQDASAWETALEQESGQPPLYYFLASLPARLVDLDAPAAVYRPNPYFLGPLGRGYWDNENRHILYPDDGLPLAGGWLALKAARWLTTVFGLLLLVALFGMVRQLWPSQPLLAFLATVLATALPQLLFISAVASNDIPAAALTALTAFCLVRLFHDPTRNLLTAWVGLAFGAAILTKANALVFGVAILAGFVWLWGTGRWRLNRFLGQGILFTLTATLAGGWWYIRGWLIYGSPFGIDTHDLTPWAITDPAQVAPFWQRWSEVFRSFWLALGWGSIRPPGHWYVAALLLVLAALYGCGRSIWRQRLDWRSPRTATVAILSLTLLANGAFLEYWMYQVVAPYGRLLYISLPLLIMILVGGWYALSPRLAAVIAGLLLLMATLPPFFLLQPAYSLPPNVPVDGDKSRDYQWEFRDEAGLPIARLGPFAPLVQQVVIPAGPEPTIVQTSLCLEALRQSEAPLTLLLHIVGPDDQLVAQRRTYPGLGHAPTNLWQPGQTYCHPVAIPVYHDQVTAELLYQVEVSFLDETTGQRLSAFAGGNRVPATFTGRILLRPESSSQLAPPNQGGLTGFELLAVETAAQWAAGASHDVVLDWTARSAQAADYQIYAHLRGADGETVLQADGPPLAGWLPTSFWQVDHIYRDSRHFTLPADLQPGAYDLVVGFYDLATVTPVGEPFPAGTITVLPPD